MVENDWRSVKKKICAFGEVPAPQNMAVLKAERRMAKHLFCTGADHHFGDMSKQSGLLMNEEGTDEMGGDTDESDTEGERETENGSRKWSCWRFGPSFWRL